VVVATVRDDMEISALSLSLAAHNVRLLRLNVDDLPDVDITTYVGDLELSLGEELLSPRVFWSRYELYHPHRALESPQTEAENILGLYVSHHSSAFVRTIEELSPYCINEDATATGRLAQQRLAARSGVRIPETTVTRDIMRGWNRVSLNEQTQFVGKVIGEHWIEHPPGVLNGTFPQVFAEAELRDAAREPAPLIVQEYVRHSHELRIYAVGAEIIAYRIAGKVAADALWTDPEGVWISPVVLEQNDADLVSDLIRSFNIDFGAFDLLVTAAGELVFLEVNLVGDWRFFEKAAGDTRVSDAVLNLILSKVQS
jgi:glutathione synthase/RimK-type ligase-like ATP-grasp enzyme